MASIDLLIPELDRKLRFLHQEQSLVTKTGKTGILEQPLLPEYLQLTTTDGIIPGVEFIVLDAFSKKNNLYEDERECQQILAAMADELNDSADSDILASIQMIQNLYPSIYQLGQAQLTLTRDRALEKISESKPLIDRSLTSEIDPPQSTPTEIVDLASQPSVNSREPQTKAGLVIGFCIASAIVGGVIATSFNKPQMATTPISINSSSPAITSDNNNPSNPVVASNTTIQNNRPSPSQAIRDHYQALNARNYDLTWDNLTSRFKSESGNASTLARKEYEDWWNSVRSIDLQRAETASISSDGSRAIVSYRHGYTMNTGRFVQDKHTHIFLVWDQGKGKWLIDRRS